MPRTHAVSRDHAPDSGALPIAGSQAMCSHASPCRQESGCKHSRPSALTTSLELIKVRVGEARQERLTSHTIHVGLFILHFLPYSLVLARTLVF